MTGAYWRKVVIDDGYATAVDRQGRDCAKASVDQLLQHLPTWSSPSGLLPPGLRWLSKDGNLVILERPPARKTMTYRAAMLYDSGGQNKIFCIPMPWQVYVIHHLFSDNPGIYTYCRPSPLQSLDDQLYVYPLSNVDHNGWVCIHIESEYPRFLQRMPAPSLSERAAFLVNTLWMAGFNRNVPTAMNNYARHAKQLQDRIRQKNLRDYDLLTVMEEASLHDVCSWDYPTTSKTLAQWVLEHEQTVGGTPTDLLAMIGNATYQLRTRS